MNLSTESMAVSTVIASLVGFENIMKQAGHNITLQDNIRIEGDVLHASFIITPNKLPENMEIKIII